MHRLYLAKQGYLYLKNNYIFLTFLLTSLLYSCSKPVLEISIEKFNKKSNEQAQGPAPFVSVWRTTAPSETITLPLRSGFNYNFTVDWGGMDPLIALLPRTAIPILLIPMSPPGIILLRSKE